MARTANWTKPQDIARTNAERTAKPWGVYCETKLLARGTTHAKALKIAAQLSKLYPGKQVHVIFEGKNLGMRSSSEFVG